MRANPAEYELVVPRSLGDALALMANNPGEWMPIAGGTDVMVLYAAGKLLGRKLVSVFSYPEMRGISVEPAEIRIGAACTYTDLRQHPVVANEFSLLTRSAAWTGGIANQNRGTLGGNIANASPAGDSLPVLLAYDADLILVSARGERRIPYRTFHTGYKKSLLGPDELIQTVCLRREFPNCVAYSKKVGARSAQAISKVFLAGVGRVVDGTIESVRLAAGSVGPIPLRLYKTEAALSNQVASDATFENAKRILQHEVQPIDDIRSSARYRSVVLGNLLREFLSSLSGARISS
ncbi:MAG: FAD binding domain-containing protein [Candidatus Acidiferrum sp.]